MAVSTSVRGVTADDTGRPRRSLLLSVALAGCVAAGAVSAITSGIEEQAAAVDAVLVGWNTLAYVLCGLVAWTRRPESRFGPLMIVAGFGPVLSRLSEVDEGLPQTVGMVCVLLPVVLFLHVFLAYPSGRLERPLDAGVLVAGYVSAIGLGVVAMMLGPSGRESSSRSPAVLRPATSYWTSEGSPSRRLR